jgi:hypothetical protein
MRNMTPNHPNIIGMQPRLSTAEKLDIIPAVFLILLAAVFALFSGITRGEKGALTFFLHVAYAILRKATRRFSMSQFQ